MLSFDDEKYTLLCYLTQPGQYEQEESRISAYQKQTEGDDPYWIEDGNADQSLNSAGDEA